MSISYFGIAEEDPSDAPDRPPIMPLLADILVSESKLGMDIGGTLAKLVVALPAEEEEEEEEEDGPGLRPDEVAAAAVECADASASPAALSAARLRRIPPVFGESGKCPPELSFAASIGGHQWHLQFLRGSTQLLHHLLSETASLQEAGSSPQALRQVVAAGGGAHKFSGLFKKAMGIELVALKEFQSLVDGLRFLHQHRPTDELFEVISSPSAEGALDWREVTLSNWPEPLYPCILVSFGSGVSILQVNSAADGDFERVGGTATGGATFLGLIHLLVSPHLTFEEALDLVAKGDSSTVDKLVGDIYGTDGCANLGMPPTMTAANFGKLISWDKKRPSDADIAAALMQMIVQASAVLVRTIAQQTKCLKRVFVVGGFMDSNPTARHAFGQNLSALKGRAIYMRHSGFLGALGSLKRCISSTEAQDARYLDPFCYDFKLGTPGISTYLWNVTCPSHLAQEREAVAKLKSGIPAAKLWFQYGMMWSYSASFSLLASLLHSGGTVEDIGSDWRWDEALRCFERCVQLEPRCAMAFWAISWVHGHRTLMLGGIDSAKDHEKCLLSLESAHFAGRRAVAIVRADASASPSASAGFSAEERSIIEASALRFAIWPPSEYARHLDRAFVGAAREISRQYPDDPDVACITAQAQLLDAVGNIEACTFNRLCWEAVANLEGIRKHHPTHSGVLLGLRTLLPVLVAAQPSLSVGDGGEIEGFSRDLPANHFLEASPQRTAWLRSVQQIIDNALRDQGEDKDLLLTKANPSRMQGAATKDQSDQSPSADEAIRALLSSRVRGESYSVVEGIPSP